MSAPTSQPPRGSFAVSQRLLRGYGPLAVLAGMLLLMSVLVPSKVQDRTELAANGGGLGPGTSTGSVTGGGSSAEGPETVVTTPDGVEAPADGGGGDGGGGEPGAGGGEGGGVAP